MNKEKRRVKIHKQIAKLERWKKWLCAVANNKIQKCKSELLLLEMN